MRLLHASALALFAASAFAHEHQRIIAQASELETWCHAETEARYVARNFTPYQWTASYHDSGNILHVEGKVRVHGDDVAVHCRIARGAREDFASIEIDDSGL